MTLPVPITSNLHQKTKIFYFNLQKLQSQERNVDSKWMKFIKKKMNLYKFFFEFLFFFYIFYKFLKEKKKNFFFIYINNMYFCYFN